MARRYPQPREFDFAWERVEEFDGQEVVTPCTVTCTIDGQDRPARWGQDGGSPPEYAEVDVVAVTMDTTGAEITDDLTGPERAELEALAEVEAGDWLADRASAAAEAAADAREDR